MPVRGLPRAFVVVLAVCHAFGQSSSAPSFDVASVKASKSGVDGFLASRVVFQSGGQRFAAVNCTLHKLIVTAYGVDETQLLGGPSWLASDGFDIEAKTEAPADREKMRLMLQTLLADRFALSLNHERKVLPVDVLTRGENPPISAPARATEGIPAIRISRDGAATLLTGENIDMPFFANYLSGRLHQIVVDRTGLTGTFDFSVSIAIDPNDAADVNVTEREIVGRLFSELVRKIGLRLRLQKMSMDVLMVEHAEKPPSN